MTAEKVKRASYTLEYKLEAVRLVQSGQSCAATAKVLGIPSQTLENLVRQATKGQLTGAGAKPVSAGVFMESSLNPIVCSSESPSFARFLICHAVTDVVDAFKGGNDLLVMGDDDDRGFELACHVIENADDGHSALTIEWRRRLIGQDHGWMVNQSASNGDSLLFTTRKL